MIESLAGFARHAAIVGFVVLTFALGFAVHGQREPSTSSENPSSTRLKQTNAILISKYMIEQGPEALLIRDHQEIEKLVSLLSENKTVGHACGYHWLIRFRQSPTVSVPFSHNENCEVYENQSALINSLLKGYSHLIKTKPAHFIYTLKVPASLAPEDAAKQLENDKQFVFFFSGVEQRLPHITIRATAASKMPNDRSRWEVVKTKNVAAAKRKLQDAVEALSHRYAITTVTDFEKRYSRSGAGRFEDGVETTLYFAPQTSLDHIETVLGSVEIRETKQPVSYNLQLVLEERYSEDVKQRLMDLYPFILAVAPFPE